MNAPTTVSLTCEEAREALECLEAYAYAYEYVPDNPEPVYSAIAKLKAFLGDEEFPSVAYTVVALIARAKLLLLAEEIRKDLLQRGIPPRTTAHRVDGGQ